MDSRLKKSNLEKKKILCIFSYASMKEKPWDLMSSVADPLHIDPDPYPTFHFDADPNPTFHFDADPDPSFQIKAQNHEKVLK